MVERVRNPHYLVAGMAATRDSYAPNRLLPPTSSSGCPLWMRWTGAALLAGAAFLIGRCFPL